MSCPVPEDPSSPETPGDEALFRELASVARDSPVATDDLLTRDAIPGYELLGEIHRGGQGTVYVARQTATKRRVALKVLTRHRGEAEREERRRFEREVELACRLRHPNIVCVFESGDAGGRLWYAMELVDGVRLDEFLATAHLDLAGRLALIEGIAAAVAVAHRTGVIHRDLKPANILVDANGTPRVVDFGLALASSGDLARRITATGAFLGTLAYMSPEQASGGEVDTRTDVHAIGLLLYEVLTGRLPWSTHGDVSKVLERVKHERPADPCALSSDVDAELRTIVMTALEKDPAQRYDSADALLRDLVRYRNGEPLAARPQSMAYVLRKAVARHRTALGIAAAVAVVVCVAAAFAVREQWRADDQRHEAALARQLMRTIVGAGSGGSMEHGEARIAALAESLERLNTELDVSPDVRASLHLSLGESYSARLLFDEAKEHLRDAVARFREAGDGEGVARSLEALAAVQCQRGSDDAVEAATEALDLRRAALPLDAVRVACGERLLARTLLARLPRQPDDVPRARELLDRAEGTLVAELGANDPDVAMIHILSASISASGADAIELYERALRVLERRPGEARRTIECLDRYAGRLASLARYDEADAVFERAANLTRQTYGERHTVDHLRRRSELERIDGNLASAERLERAALATELDGWIELRPDDEPRLGPLAASVREGEPVPYVDAFSALRELRGDSDFNLSSWMNQIARLLDELERHGEAEALLRESLWIHCRIYGLDCPNRQETLYLLAAQLADRELDREAADCLDELLERAAPASPDDALVAKALELRKRLSVGTVQAP